MRDELLLQCSLSRWGGSSRRCRWCDAELPPRHRRWCSGRCRHLCSINHLWQAARQAALDRDNSTCVECGEVAAEWPLRVEVQVHHKDPVFGAREMSCLHHLDGLETLCSLWWDGRQSCHSRVHHGEIVPGGKQLTIDVLVA